MSDIVERLREIAGKYDEYAIHGDLELEAADEIARLRTVLANLKYELTMPPPSYYGRIIARATGIIDTVLGVQNEPAGSTAPADPYVEQEGLNDF